MTSKERIGLVAKLIDGGYHTAAELGGLSSDPALPGRAARMAHGTGSGVEPSSEEGEKKCTV